MIPSRLLAALALETRDDPMWTGAPLTDEDCDQLRKMADGEGFMAELIEALKEEGVRLEEGDLPDGQPEGGDQRVVIIRGGKAELVKRLLYGGEGFGPGEVIRQQKRHAASLDQAAPEVDPKGAHS